MAYEIGKENVQTLAEYGCTIRTYIRSSMLKREPKKNPDGSIVRDENGHEVEDPQGKWLKDDNGNVMIPAGGVVYAEVIDNATGEAYISEPGADPKDACDNAIKKIPFTEKPKTKAQKLVEEKLRIKSEAESKVLAEKQSELDAALAEIKALKEREAMRSQTVSGRRAATMPIAPAPQAG